MCRLLGAEPYMAVDSGFGEARSAADLVEYCNGSQQTPMGKLRAANGHPDPYKIKYWGIGNEMYGIWQYGHIQLYQYWVKHAMFTKAMKKVDPTIIVTALLKKLDRSAAGCLDDIGYVQQDREEMEVLLTFLAERYEQRDDHQQPGVLEMGSNLQGPDDEDGGH